MSLCIIGNGFGWPRNKLTWLTPPFFFLDLFKERINSHFAVEILTFFHAEICPNVKHICSHSHAAHLNVLVSPFFGLVSRPSGKEEKLALPHGACSRNKSQQAA